MTSRFQQVDVFATGPCSGNPVAVVLDAEGLTTGQMQRFTRWMNLSETTFVLPPSSMEADYRVRIFTLAHELDFAGHPTLGTCHAWLAAGGQPRDPDRIVQECGAGLIPIRRSEAGLAFAAPPLVRSGPLDDEVFRRALEALRIDRSEVVDAAWVDNGPGWSGLLLADADRVLEVEPSSGSPAAEGGLFVGLVGPHPSGSEHAFEVRAFFSDQHGALREDPVTGSLNASLAQWLLGTDRASAPYTVRQGTRLDRAGDVRIDQDDEAVWVGGATTTLVAGEATL